MAEAICHQVRDAAAEYALGILPPHGRSQIAAHTLHCQDCRAEIDTMISVASRLADLIPGTEPPLGFDRLVLNRLSGPTRRRRLWLAVGAVAASAALALGSLGLVPGRDAEDHIALTSVLRQAGRPVGKIFTYGARPAWVAVMIRGTSTTGPITCQLQYRDGTVVTLGTFDLTTGDRSWSAPDPSGVSGLIAVRLIDSTGQLIATATFP
jgi:hypothetical protein